jgi:predicted NUDIX family phosphoesterase
MSKYDNEHVLVVKRELLDSIGSFQGLSADTASYLQPFLSEHNNFFMLRDLAEDDPSHKQIIPYAIFHHGGKFLHYVRGKKSGEQRLATKGSIGIGGHINTEDAEAASLERDTYMTGVDREMNEELVISSKYEQRIVALINDDSNEVGQVHLGVVHLFELETPEVSANEAAISELEFLSHDELKSRRDRLETWSQICVDGFEQLGLG